MARLFALLFVVGFVCTYFWLIIAALVAFGVACYGLACLERAIEARENRLAEREALVWRCDQQHAWVLAGR